MFSSSISHHHPIKISLVGGSPPRFLEKCGLPKDMDRVRLVKIPASLLKYRTRAGLHTVLILLCCCITTLRTGMTVSDIQYIAMHVPKNLISLGALGNRSFWVRSFTSM